MSAPPIISIIIPLYNQAAYVSSAIESVLGQSLSDWELIIVDNGSEDGGGAIAQSYSDPRIKLLNLPERSGGPGKPRNHGLNYAQGDWVLFLDADDTLESNHLETLLDTAQEHPTAAVIAGHWQEYPADAPMDRVLMPPAGYPQNASELPTLSVGFAPWAIHAAIVKRSILVPPYRWVEALDPYLSEDTAFWFRVLSKYPCAYSAGQGALYQKLPHSRNQVINPVVWLRGVRAVTDSNVSFLQDQGIPLSAKHCEIMMRLYSSIYLMAREHRDRQTAAIALGIAQYWLSECFMLKGCTSLSLKVRKVLGLSRFLFITSLQSTFSRFFKSPSLL